jgi:hypothetical protein
MSNPRIQVPLESLKENEKQILSYNLVTTEKTSFPSTLALAVTLASLQGPPSALSTFKVATALSPGPILFVF